jgi:hypothetical protein
MRHDDGHDDLMKVGQTLHRIGKGLLVDLGIFRTESVADGLIGSGRERETHGTTPSET